MFEGRAPSFADETVQNNASAKFDNIGLTTGGECKLTAKMGNKANVAIKDTQVQLSRTADGTWSCKIKPAGTANGGWKDKFIPSGCEKETTAGNGTNGWF